MGSLSFIIYTGLNYEKIKTYHGNKKYRDLESFSKNHDLMKNILDENFVKEVKNKHTIKALNRNNAGSLLVENTIWKDLEVYAIRDPSDLKN